MQINQLQPLRRVHPSRLRDLKVVIGDVIPKRRAQFVGDELPVVRNQLGGRCVLARSGETAAGRQARGETKQQRQYGAGPNCGRAVR